jgi:hypothetical protein
MVAARMSVRCAVLCGVFWALCGPAAAQAQPVEASRIRILLIVDDQAPSAAINGFAHDRSAFKKVIQGIFRDLHLEDRYTLDILDGNKAVRGKVLDYYRDLKAETNEALICYFSGHGGADPRSGHFLDLDDGPLPRSELRAAMLAKKARLVVLITDCCADFPRCGVDVPRDADRCEQPLTLTTGEPSAPAIAKHAVRRQPPGETLRQLFFHHRGIVDISACQIGKQAFSRNNVGGYFTLSLVALLHAPHQVFARNANGVVSWSSFFMALRSSTEEAAGRDRNVQTPVAFSLGKMPGKN